METEGERQLSVTRAERRRQEREARKAPAAVAPDRPAAEPVFDKVVIAKRYNPFTGVPQVCVDFQMRDMNNRRQYTVNVGMAEAIADQILTLCDAIRIEHGDEMFAETPEVTPDS